MNFMLIGKYIPVSLNLLDGDDLINIMIIKIKKTMFILL